MIALSFDELVAWTDEERAKWEAWFATHADALTLKLKGDRFGTVGGLIAHIFEAEFRQAHRFGPGPVPPRVDPPSDTAANLFAAGKKSRAFYVAEAKKVAPADWNTVLSFETPGGAIRVSKRKLALHLLMHETRHWAQIARTVREHDIAPPGKHDLMFSERVQ